MYGKIIEVIMWKKEPCFSFFYSIFYLVRKPTSCTKRKSMMSLKRQCHKILADKNRIKSKIRKVVTNQWIVLVLVHRRTAVVHSSTIAYFNICKYLERWLENKNTNFTLLKSNFLKMKDKILHGMCRNFLNTCTVIKAYSNILISMYTWFRVPV